MPGKSFYGPKTDVHRQNCKGKKWVKIWRFSKVKFKRNELDHRKEHEILSEKVYYNKSLTQTHEEIRPFKVKNSVKSITV